MLRIIKKKPKNFINPNIKNYSTYIDNFYLNMNRTVKRCLNCNKYHTKCNEKISIFIGLSYNFSKFFKILPKSI